MLYAKQTLPIMGFITICFLSASTPLLATVINNTRCPVEPTELAVSKYKSNYKGNTIYFCCNECVSIFNDKPKPYLNTIADFNNVKSGQDNKSALQKIFDDTWNTVFSYPGISVLLISCIGILLLRFASSKFPNSRFTTKCARKFSTTRSIQL